MCVEMGGWVRKGGVLKKKVMCFEVYIDNNRLFNIDKFAGQLRYIPNRFSVGRVPCNQQLEFVFFA